MAKGGRRSGAHTHTRLCSDRFNVFVTKKKAFLSSPFHPHPPLTPPHGSTERHRIYNVLSKYTCFERKVDIIQADSVVQKHEYVQPWSPPSLM